MEDLNDESFGFFYGQDERRFHVWWCFYLVVEGQDEDSCGKIRISESPRGKRSLARKSTVV